MEMILRKCHFLTLRPFPLFRAANQVILLHRAQEHPRLRAQGHYAFPRQLHQRPTPVVPRLLALQGRSDRHAALRVGAHRAAAEGGRRNAHGAPEGVADHQRDPRNARLVKERALTFSFRRLTYLCNEIHSILARSMPRSQKSYIVCSCETVPQVVSLQPISILCGILADLLPEIQRMRA